MLDPPSWAALAPAHFGMPVRVVVPADATGGHLALCELHAPPGTAGPVHRHEHEDELIHVTRGSVEVWQPHGRCTVAAGDSLLLPRGRPHRLENPADRGAALLAVFLPGGVEQALLAASVAAGAGPLDRDDAAALLAQSGVSLFGWDAHRPA